MIRNTRYGLLSLAAATALVVSACGTTDTGGGNAEGDDCSVKIGAMGAFTGSNASIVLPSIDGAKLALEDWKKDHDECEVELELFDTEGDPKNAPAAANKIAGDDDYIGVLGGGFSGETRATKKTFQQAGVTMISQSATATDLTQTDKAEVFHRVIAYDDVQGAAIATYLRDVVKAEKVYVVADDSTYGKGLGDIVKKELGAAVVGTDDVKTGQTEFSATVSQVKRANPDWVFYAGYTAEASPFVKQLRDADVAAKFLAGDGVYGADFPKGAGAAAEGAVVTCPCLPASEIEGSFAEDFTEAYGEPGAYAGEGYDAMKIFLDGIADGATTREKMLEFVSSYDADGITKRLSFDENGDVQKENVVVWAYLVKDGKIEKIQEIPLD